MRLSALLLVLLLLPAAAMAERIVDIARFQGVRGNALIGYGLVVGLPGTGDDNLVYTVQSMRSAAAALGLSIPPVTTQLKNSAAVMLTAELPAFAKPGQRIDVVVSALGRAKSLRGGTLLLSELRGPDGETYALAQGNLTAFAVGSFSAIPVILGYNDAEAARIDAGGFRFAQQIQVTADAGTGQRMLTAQPDGHHAPIAAVTWDGADIRVNTRQVAQRYIHTQGTPSATWTIIHNLGCYPSVTVVDSGGTVGWAEVVYDSANQLRVLLASAQAGNAYLN